MSRFENKYLVPVERTSELREFLSTYVDVDNFASSSGNNTYTVRSIYYDTRNLLFYHEKLDGLRNRKKLRIRGYDLQNENSVTFLEIKRKNDARVSKNRCPVYYKNLPLLLSTSDIDSYAGLLNDQNGSLKNARKFFYYMHKLSLKPAIKVVYDREAYFYKYNRALRITFDKNLRGSMFCDSDSLFADSDTNYPMPKHFILEIKGKGPYPPWLQFIIGEMALRQQALSKYTICIDSHMKFAPPLSYFQRTR